MSAHKRTRRMHSATDSSQSVFVTTVSQAGHTASTGKQAVKGSHGTLITTAKGVQLLASWDMDAAYRKLEPQSPRWDYALAVHSAEEQLVWVEVHPASSTGQVDEMLAKFDWLKHKLSEPKFEPLDQLTKVTQGRNQPAFRWLCTGSNRIKPGSQETRKLARAGLTPPERQITL